MAKKMTTGQKVIIGVAVLGAGYLVYKMINKPKAVTYPTGSIPQAGSTGGSTAGGLSGLLPLLNSLKGLFGGSSSSGSGSTSTDTAGDNTGSGSSPAGGGILAGTRRNALYAWHG